MIGPVLQRYGFELVEDPERLRNLVEYQCTKQQLPAPPEETWVPVQERWLSGWPLRGSALFLDRYRQLRVGIIRGLGGVGMESWLDQLPNITVMPTPRAEVDVGRQPGSQPSLTEGLARLGWGGRLVLDLTPQQLPASLQESELHIVGSDEQQPTMLRCDRGLWRQGWLKLENVSLQGQLEIQGGLVELQRCTVQPGSQIRLTQPGALLVLDSSDLFGEVEAAACTLVQAVHANFEGGTCGLDSAGLVALQGVALSGQTQLCLRLRGRARAQLEDCQLRESTHGLHLSEQSQASLRQCWLRDHRGSGVVAVGQTRLHMEACQLRDNGGDGLELRGDTQLSLVGCTIQANGQAGIRVCDRVVVEQYENSVRHNPAGDWLESRS